MDYFDIIVEGNNYLIKPSLENERLYFVTEINSIEVVFKATENGLKAIDDTSVDRNLLEKIASEIEAHLM
ncbi:MAG TPA: hypothetical protein VN040_14870 [Pseudosphingobacterium sp.]|nr:hypothetical protein [Pseudosphingobacterium sp.]